MVVTFFSQQKLKELWCNDVMECNYKGVKTGGGEGKT